MRYPSFDNGDPLIYHRLTALGRRREARGIEAVRALIAQGLVLTPFEDRSEDESGEMHGIDPIDIAAGDGAAVFLSPFSPVGDHAWQKPWVKNAPGVAFRLSDLLELGKVSVRPSDFQAEYIQITAHEGVENAKREMEHQVEVWDQPGMMEALSDAFALVRQAETYEARDAIMAIARNQAGMFAEVDPKAFLEPARAAAERATQFIEDFLPRPEESEDDDEYWDDTVTELTESIVDAVVTAFGMWESPTVSKHAEVLFWGPLPLSKAAILFDTTQIVRNRYFDSTLNGLAMPAIRSR